MCTRGVKCPNTPNLYITLMFGYHTHLDFVRFSRNTFSGGWKNWYFIMVQRFYVNLNLEFMICKAHLEKISWFQKKNQEYPLPYDVFIDIKRDQSHEVGSEQSREFLLLLWKHKVWQILNRLHTENIWINLMESVWFYWR